MYVFFPWKRWETCDIGKQKRMQLMMLSGWLKVEGAELRIHYRYLMCMYSYTISLLKFTVLYIYILREIDRRTKGIFFHLVLKQWHFYDLMVYSNTQNIWGPNVATFLQDMILKWTSRLSWGMSGRTHEAPKMTIQAGLPNNRCSLYCVCVTGIYIYIYIYHVYKYMYLHTYVEMIPFPSSTKDSENVDFSTETIHAGKLTARTGK